MKEKYEEIIKFLKDYKERAHANGYVLNVSGGKDSTVVGKLLVDSVGSNKVFGIIQPNGNQQDLDDAIRVCNLLKISYTIINIENLYNSIISNIEQNTTITITDKSKTNICPRLRMTIAYAIAQSLGYLVAGTGNRSEAFIGWCTKWGDMACDINPIAHLTCTEVIELGDYLKLPYELVHKAPADGLTGKTDEENIGLSYEVIDYLITQGWSPFEFPVEVAQKFNDLHTKAIHKFAPIILRYNE